MLRWGGPDSCENFAGKPYAVWISDDSDKLNGNIVKDGYLEGVDGAGCSVGAAGATGTGAGTLAAVAAALLGISRRRRRSSPTT